jgi:hypothetical protein
VNADTTVMEFSVERRGGDGGRKLGRMQDSFVGYTLTMWSHLSRRFRGHKNGRPAGA